MDRHRADCATSFTRQIDLKAPFISANMDTVTEAPMAIAMDEFGGIGVIHRFLPIDVEVGEVSRVKRYQSQVIEDPHTIAPDATVGDARRLMAQLGIGGLPVVEDGRRMLGLITRRDLQLVEDERAVRERMTPNERLITGSPGTTLEQARLTMSQHRLEKLPLVDKEGRLAGLITTKDLSKNLGSNRATRDEKGRLRVAAAVGVVGDFLERAHALAQAGVDALVIDIAHGDSALMHSAIGQIREQLADVPLVAGNVATAGATERLIEAGVDGIKVGVGPGSMCITRQVSGVGVPQFTAVLEAARVASARGVPVIADGGIRLPGDVAKAVGAGASTVMLGNLLAGTDESPGVVVVRGGQRMKMNRGMASKEAALDRALRDDPAHGWALWESEEADVAAEGVQAPVNYRGAVHEVLQNLLSGLRSGMSYCGASTIDQMWDKAVFVRQSEAGLREAGPHDVLDL